MDSSLRWNDEVERLFRVGQRPERSEESCSTSNKCALAERLALANSRKRNKINKKRHRKSPAASSCEPVQVSIRNRGATCSAPSAMCASRTAGRSAAQCACRRGHRDNHGRSHHGIRHGRGQRQCRWQLRCRGRGRKRPSWTGPGRVKPFSGDGQGSNSSDSGFLEHGSSPKSGFQFLFLFFVCPVTGAVGLQINCP